MQKQASLCERDMTSLYYSTTTYMSTWARHVYILQGYKEYFKFSLCMYTPPELVDVTDVTNPPDGELPAQLLARGRAGHAQLVLHHVGLADAHVVVLGHEGGGGADAAAPDVVLVRAHDGDGGGRVGAVHRHVAVAVGGSHQSPLLGQLGKVLR